jgi:hypothetical protein
MFERGVVSRALLEITRAGTDDRALAEHICRACVDGLDVDGAAISLLTGSPARTTLWASDATAQKLEDLQFTFNEGACMQAAAIGSPVFVPDLYDSTDAARWPVFAAAVADQTLARALFVLPLQWGTVNLGVLDLYRASPGDLSAVQRREAIAVADTAALMLLGLRTDPGNGAWLNRVLGARTEIHQATGMVLVQLGLSPEDALARMRGYAFVHERLLVDVARDVVARRLSFAEDTV